MDPLTGRVAVVTGAGAGIGRALCLELARAGARLVLADMSEDGLQATAREVEALGPPPLCVRVDVRERAEVQALLDRTLQALGRCDIVVNNAGVFHAHSLLGAAPEQWQRVLSTNLWGVVHGCHVFGNHFVDRGAGHIVNTASAAGLFPIPGMSAYSTSKAAVLMLSEQLRWELADKGVGVTVLCPGVVKTDIGKAEGAGLSHLDVTAMSRSWPPPEPLARKAVHAIRRNRFMVRYGADAYVLSLLRALPRWLTAPLGRFMARTAMRVLGLNQGAGQK